MRVLRITAVASLLTALVAGAAFGFQGKEFNQTVAFDSGETLNLKAYKGSIHIRSWDRPEVAVYARIEPPDGETADYAARVVQATRVEVRKSGSTLNVRSDYDDVPSKDGWGEWFGGSKNLAYVHYDIKAPRELRLRLDDYKSSIELYGLSGDLRVETYKGDVRASDLDGRLSLETYKGEAQLTDLSGSLDIETYKGEISIQTTRLEGDSKLETYRGEIVLSIPANQGLEVRGELGRKARLSSDFAIEAESAEEPDERRKRRRKQTIAQTINQGGPVLSINSYKGEIKIKRW